MELHHHHPLAHGLSVRMKPWTAEDDLHVSHPLGKERRLHGEGTVVGDGLRDGRYGRPTGGRHVRRGEYFHPVLCRVFGRLALLLVEGALVAVVVKKGPTI